MSVPGAPALIRRLKAILEPSMRRHALAEALDAGEAPAWVEVIADLIERAAAGQDPDAQAALDCLTHAVDEQSLSYEARVALYEAATDVGLHAVARLFLTVSPLTASERELDRALEPERRLVPKGRTLTLGERKALARSPRREALGPLLRDPHPDVVTILLDNPHLTERDVVTIAAQRPCVPAAQLCIAAHPRWSVRYAVKRALVLNPYTPAHVAVRLATTLRRADLLAIAADTHLAPALRAQAAELVARVGRRPRPRST